MTTKNPIFKLPILLLIAIFILSNISYASIPPDTLRSKRTGESDRKNWVDSVFKDSGKDAGEPSKDKIDALDLAFNERVGYEEAFDKGRAVRLIGYGRKTITLEQLSQAFIDNNPETGLTIQGLLADLIKARAFLNRVWSDEFMLEVASKLTDPAVMPETSLNELRKRIASEQEKLRGLKERLSKLKGDSQERLDIKIELKKKQAGLLPMSDRRDFLNKLNRIERDFSIEKHRLKALGDLFINNARFITFLFGKNALDPNLVYADDEAKEIFLMGHMGAFRYSPLSADGQARTHYETLAILLGYAEYENQEEAVRAYRRKLVHEFTSYVTGEFIYEPTEGDEDIALIRSINQKIRGKAAETIKATHKISAGSLNDIEAVPLTGIMDSKGGFLDYLKDLDQNKAVVVIAKDRGKLGLEIEEFRKETGLDLADLVHIKVAREGDLSKEDVLEQLDPFFEGFNKPVNLAELAGYEGVVDAIATDIIRGEKVAASTISPFDLLEYMIRNDHNEHNPITKGEIQKAIQNPNTKKPYAKAVISRWLMSLMEEKGIGVLKRKGYNYYLTKPIPLGQLSIIKERMSHMKDSKGELLDPGRSRYNELDTDTKERIEDMINDVIGYKVGIEDAAFALKIVSLEEGAILKLDNENLHEHPNVNNPRLLLRGLLFSGLISPACEMAGNTYNFTFINKPRIGVRDVRRVFFKDEFFFKTISKTILSELGDDSFNTPAETQGIFLSQLEEYSRTQQKVVIVVSREDFSKMDWVYSLLDSGKIEIVPGAPAKEAWENLFGTGDFFEIDGLIRTAPDLFKNKDCIKALEGIGQHLLAGKEKDKGTPKHLWLVLAKNEYVAGDIVTEDKIKDLRLRNKDRTRWSLRTVGREIDGLEYTNGIGVFKKVEGGYRMLVTATPDQIESIDSNLKKKNVLGKAGQEGELLGLDSHRLDKEHLTLVGFSRVEKESVVAMIPGKRIIDQIRDEIIGVLKQDSDNPFDYMPQDRIITATAETIKKMGKVKKEGLVDFINRGYILSIATNTKEESYINSVIDSFSNPGYIRELIKEDKVVFSLVADNSILAAIEALAERRPTERTADILTKEQVEALKSGV